MVSLLVRNYSVHFHCCCCCYFFFCCCLFCCFCVYLFQSLAHFMSTNTKPSGTIGDTQKTMTISATSFRGCNRFSPLLICPVPVLQFSFRRSLHQIPKMPRPVPMSFDSEVEEGSPTTAVVGLPSSTSLSNPKRLRRFASRDLHGVFDGVWVSGLSLPTNLTSWVPC